MKNRMFYKKTERYISKIQNILQAKPLYKRKNRPVKLRTFSTHICKL